MRIALISAIDSKVEPELEPRPLAGRTIAHRQVDLAVRRCKPHDVSGLRCHDARLGHLHAQRGQEFRDRLQVHVLRSARKQFVADEQNGGFDLALRHKRMIAARSGGVR